MPAQEPPELRDFRKPGVPSLTYCCGQSRNWKIAACTDHSPDLTGVEDATFTRKKGGVRRLRLPKAKASPPAYRVEAFA